MKNNNLGNIWIISGLIALSGWATTTVDAQVNESRALRQASGVYQGGLKKIKRVREYTVTYDDATGKMRVPVTENKFKSNLNDDELAGSDSAKVAGDGKNANVTRGGKKIAYSVNKGSVDTLQDGHAPIKNGTAKGGMVLRGRDWVAGLALKGKRVDNDSMISTFSAEGNGKH